MTDSNGNLAEYIAAVTGRDSELAPVPGNRLKGLPVFQAQAYRFLRLEWLGQTLILAQADSGAAPPPIGRLRTQCRNLADHFGCPVVFVFPMLDTYHRNRFASEGIPFIVPGRQLFIPPFADFSEQVQRRRNMARFSAAAQAVVLAALYRLCEEGRLVREWAEALGYSAMTLSHARRELAEAGLCEAQDGRRARGMRFLFRGRELWDRARPRLRTPVSARRWARFDRKPAELVVAGLTALSEQTLLQDDETPVYAVSRKCVKTLIGQNDIRLLDYPDDATACLETWIYDPALFAADGRADRLSLYLSLADDPDVRVGQALDRLMEEMTW